MDFDLDHYIERLLAAWSNSFRKIHSEIMQHSELGLTGPQFQMLSLIYRSKSCNVSYLSEKLDVKPSAITVMADRLVQSGYIERRHDEQDRRAVLLSVTEHGADVYKEAGNRSRKVLKAHLSDLTSHELETLIGVIEKLAQNDVPKSDRD
ncbi:MarR family transcriptional regulator [Paenibacillus antibioticophila]|uniref:MarR family transcriptional regulator n=1 Tax=Paenibacillus antibioticophila TaxID=1274374 RepID=A0A919XWA9_9BACL|nr:MarR family transcriptional regulator [Paenibacillus antibioticophila]GIO38813.1 MarR family transcriptional regulator [Paenibacillus antibioticophila]